MRAADRPRLDLAFYALANVGGVVAYLPLLALLLPLKVAAMAGGGRLGLLATCAVTGSIVAGAANILFGWAGDRARARGGGRRSWLLGGAAATALSFAGVAAATTPGAVVAAIILFQLAVNMLLAQVAALMADEVPDARKGVAAGLLALGPPAGAGVSALLVAGTLGEGARLAVVAVVVVACTLPLAWMRPAPLATPRPRPPERMRRRRDLGVAWAARLLVQVAGCGIQLYLLYYFEALADGGRDVASGVARLLLVGALLAGPLAIALGRWSDRTRRRKPFLVSSAAAAAAGLVVMAAARDWNAGAAGFVLFASGSAVYSALNMGLAMQLLPDPARRGRDLGLINLANTLPATIGPAIAWALASAGDFSAALLALALLTAVGGGLTLLVRESD